MKITLVAPRCSRRPMDSLWKVRMSPPLGLLTIGALTPREHEVTLADENVQRCRFRDTPNLDARYRMKPIPNILAEIESLGIKHVMFIDDNFIGDPKRAWELVSALRPLRLTWHTAVSADIHRHPALLDAMAGSGCRSLFIGFETVNPRNIADCHKSQNRIADYDRTIAMVHERGMMLNASVVFGFDNDGPDVFDNTVDWLERNHVSTMTAHILTPYPGTRLYRQLEAQGRIVDRDLRHYNTSYVVFRPALMTPEELSEGYRRTYDRFYSWASILSRIPVVAGQTVAYLEFNLLYRKFGKFTSRVGSLIGMRTLAKLAKAFAYPTDPPDDLFDYRPSRRGVVPHRPPAFCLARPPTTAGGALL